MEAQAYCARCRIVLDHKWCDGVVSWIHPTARAKSDPSVGDHDPEPVITFDQAMLDARTHCDFCDGASPGWTYPCESFKVTEGYGSAGDWAACDECAAFIEAGRYKALARHCSEGREFMRDALTVFYETFAKHRTGPRYRHRP